MKTLLSLLGIVLFAPSLVAQDALIPQDLPIELRRNEAVRRKVEHPIPPVLPLQRPSNHIDRVLNRLWTPNLQTPAAESNAGAVSLEDRIAALEAKVEALENDLETQKALIKQLEESLDQLKKN